MVKKNTDEKVAACTSAAQAIPVSLKGNITAERRFDDTSAINSNQNDVPDSMKIDTSCDFDDGSQFDHEDDVLKNNASGSILFASSTNENPQENWRNKNLDVAKPFKPRRSQNSILVPSKDCSRLPVLKNANTWRARKTNQPVITSNTCPFDTLFQLYAACYFDSKSFRELADRNTSSGFIRLLVEFCKLGNIEVILEQRQQLLLAVFHDRVETIRNIRKLDCLMSVMDMFIALVEQNNILYSLTETRDCPNRLRHDYITRTTFPISTRNLDVRHIDRSFRLKNNTINCGTCRAGSERHIVRSFSPIIILDLDGVTSPGVKIHEIQPLLNVQGDEYKICGVIESLHYHFIAHVLRCNGEWQTYDDIHPNSRKNISSTYIPNRPVLLMYSK